MPKAFDFSKVGKTTQGRYLIEYNPKLDSFFTYAILRFNKKEKIMKRFLSNFLAGSNVLPELLMTGCLIIY